MDDGQLVTRMRNGDQNAWEELVDRHSSLLWRLARSIVNDDALATDAMQTAWLQLLQNLERLSNPSSVRSWLCTTTRREAIALGKARQRQMPTDPHSWNLDAPTTLAHDPAAAVDKTIEHETVLAEFEKLSDRCRQILTLLAHRVAYAAIAETMVMPVGSIGPTKTRCLDTLRKLPEIAKLGAVK